MKANLPKAKKAPTSWYKLPEYEREAITEFCGQSVQEQVDHEEAELQKVWLKVGCIANHDVFDADEVLAKAWLHKWKRLYRIIARFKTTEERNAWLDSEMEKIFGKDGYPSEWVDSLENGGK